MKQTWKKLSAKIDARTLRERVFLFGGIAGVLIFLMFSLFLNPSYSKQRVLLDEMARQRDRIAAVEAEIAQTIVAHTIDPDASERARLARIRSDAAALSASLTAMQQGMVPPERMSTLLGQILRGHRGLRLVSMRTLSDSDAPTPAPASGAAAAVASPDTEQLLKRHGVELVVQGSYADMVSYMSALEGMQGQLFWGSATLRVESYPTASLTLVAYTINLDKKWLKL